jgi:NAD dependent epimerase/dehydratase
MSFWPGRPVVVTGAEGFIGSTLTDLLVDAGADVTAFVHYKPYGEHGHLADHLIANRIKVVAGDIRDPWQVQDVLAGADTVFHLAALIGIPYSFEAPDAYIQANVVGTHNVLAGAKRHHLRRVLTTSTSEVYGSALTVPISEDHPLQAQSPYSASKIGGDMIAMSYFKSFGTPVTIVRPFNTYGPRQSARAVIPAILQQLHSGATEIRIGLRTPTRDFTYSTDTASGFIAAAEHGDAVGRTLNLGTGREVSVGDLVELLIKVSGKHAEIITDTSRIRPEGSEVTRLLADNRRMRELTGWNPAVSLEEGLARTSDWIAANVLRDAARYQL